MENKDIRWKQRFMNFEKALGYLEKGLQTSNPDIIQKAGIIKFFEISYELAWNTIKDFLEQQGFQDINSPRASLKKAFETGLIESGHDWMELLGNRNLTAHTYDEAKVTEIEKLIHHKYFLLLKALYENLKKLQDG